MRRNTAAVVLVVAAAVSGCKRRPPAVATPPDAIAPAPAPVPSHVLRRPEDRVRLAVIGDYGIGDENEAAVARLVHGWNPDFVVTTGDNNYPRGEATTIDDHVGRYYARFIGNYRGAFGPGASENRFFPSPGNHDWISGLGPYTDYFTLPGNERYYEVDWGLVRLFIIDTDVHEPDGVGADSIQARWLRERLQQSRACYDLVAGHHAPWSSGSTHGSTERMRWPLAAWGAEAAFFGHEHVYERFEIDGIPYFTNGLGGAGRYGFALTPLPETRKRFVADFGAMLVSAGDASITYEFFTVQGARIDALHVPAKPGCATEGPRP